MKLYTTTIHDCQTGNRILTGIFSESFKAEEQARVWVEGATDHRAEVYDREVNPVSGDESIYYRAKNNDTYEYYTANIEVYTLNELSY